MSRLKLYVALFYLVAAGFCFHTWISARLPPNLQIGYARSWYESVEQALLQRKLALRPTDPPTQDVVVVSFDERWFKIYGPLPWPRDVYASLLRKLHTLGARTVVMDLLFFDPETKFLSPAAFRSLFPDLGLDDIPIVNFSNYVGELQRRLEEKESALREELKRSGASLEDSERRLSAFAAQRAQLLELSRHIAEGDGSRAFEIAATEHHNVIFPTDFRNCRFFPVSPPEALDLAVKQGLASVGQELALEEYPKLRTLYPRLLRAGAVIGVNEVVPKYKPEHRLKPSERSNLPFVASASALIRYRSRPEDPAFCDSRGIPDPERQVREAVLPASMVRGVAHFVGAKELKAERVGEQVRLTLGPKTALLEGDGSFPLAYYSDRGFPEVIPAFEVITEKKSAGRVAGKLVIVDIRTAELEHLRVMTPIRGELWPSEVKATLASNLLLDHRGPTVARPLWLSVAEGCCIWVLPVLFLILAFRVSLPYSLAVGLLFAAAIAGLDLFLLYMPLKLWFASGMLLIEIALLMVANVGAHYLIQHAERQKVRRAFGFYLPERVLEHVLKDESALRLGGERRNLSILFSDIRGFTSISERSTPEALGAALNVHLTELTQVIFDHDGTLDKYMGDCIMAFFGAPIASAEHAAQAVLAALRMQERLREIQNVWQERCGSEAHIGVGVASGDVIVGNMGSEKLFDYTVIGDTVNLASRLEGLTKVYGAPVLVSEETRHQVGERVTFAEVDVVRVKGKKEPVRIYEAVCEGQPPEPRQQYDACCLRGIHAYRRREWGAAREAFAQALVLRPGARLPALYKERMDKVDPSAIPADWDGVTAFDHK